MVLFRKTIKKKDKQKLEELQTQEKISDETKDKTKIKKIKTTIKNAIINANTRLANTMNGKTQWFLFSNIFFTEPWEGGADWTGLTTYYIDEAWEILTSPNDAINTDHEAVSGWKMEQAEGNAIDDIGDEPFSQMEEIRDLAVGFAVSQSAEGQLWKFSE